MNGRKEGGKEGDKKSCWKSTYNRTYWMVIRSRYNTGCCKNHGDDLVCGSNVHHSKEHRQSPEMERRSMLEDRFKPVYFVILPLMSLSDKLERDLVRESEEQGRKGSLKIPAKWSSHFVKVDSYCSRNFLLTDYLHTPTKSCCVIVLDIISKNLASALLMTQKQLTT